MRARVVIVVKIQFTGANLLTPVADVIKVIELKNNNLVSLQKVHFEQLHVLRSLDVSGNNITVLNNQSLGRIER